MPLDDLLEPLGVVRHEASVTAIDTVERRVALDDGSTLAYDQLVLAAGSRLALPGGAGRVLRRQPRAGGISLRSPPARSARSRRSKRAPITDSPSDPVGHFSTGKTGAHFDRP